MLGISSNIGRSYLPLDFSIIIAVFISNNYGSVRVLGISSNIKKSYLPLEFSVAIAVFISSNYRSIRVLGIPLCA